MRISIFTYYTIKCANNNEMYLTNNGNIDK